MNRIRILDCTLRDGGFVNDWEFGLGSIKSIITRLDRSGIDFIELGFLDQRRASDPNRSIFPDTASIRPVLNGLDLKRSTRVAMIDFGTCHLDALQPAIESGIQAIRVIFKKKDIPAALAFCAGVKARGYQVFVNPVSVTSYSDAEITDLLRQVNALAPFGVSLVDTYGLLHKRELLHVFQLMDRLLADEIVVGYHAHNNFQLAYANCLELLDVETKRPLVLDSTLYGMGKGAGNANTELLALYLNRYLGTDYDVDELLEAIDVNIMKEYTKRYWGYSLMHYLAASNDCHPDYAKSLIDKKSLSVKSINTILQGLDAGTRLTFSASLIEERYRHHQDVLVDDATAYRNLSSHIAGRQVLLLGPGNSLESHAAEIAAFVREAKPVTVAIHCVPKSFASDFLFFANAKRYSQFFDEIHRTSSPAQVICTSNITAQGKPIDYVLRFSALLAEEPVVRDNPLLMFLKVLKQFSPVSVALAGFDGYSDDMAGNYYSDYIKFLYCDDNVLLRNDALRLSISEMRNELDISFITPSRYE